LYSLKVYFWLFLFLDGLVLFLMFNKKSNNNKNVFELLFGKKKKDNQNLNTNNNQQMVNENPQINKRNVNNLTRKKVKFNLEPQYESSDSDSDIGTDIDLASFRESLME